MSKNKLYPNTTQVLNFIFDIVMSFLSGAEFKVLMFFLRQTYGFQRYNKVGYALTQIADGIVSENGNRLTFGTGLHKNSVQNAIDKLQEYGILKIKRGDYNSAVCNMYALTFMDDDFDLKTVINKVASIEEIDIASYQKMVRDDTKNCDDTIPKIVISCNKEKQSSNKDVLDDGVPSSSPLQKNIEENSVYNKTNAITTNKTPKIAPPPQGYNENIDVFFRKAKEIGITKPVFGNKEGKILKLLMKSHGNDLSKHIEIYFDKKIGEYSGYRFANLSTDIQKIQLALASANPVKRREEGSAIA